MGPSGCIVMPKAILISKVARKQLNSLPKDMQLRVKTVLYALNESEKKKTQDIKRLKGIDGREDLFRLRIGDYRVVYFQDANSFKVIQIFHRKKGYKWL
jgi:mRNA interferase RelE/StbE